MFLKIKYEDVGDRICSGRVNDKRVNLLLRVEVNKDNIIEALERLGGSRGIAGFYYVGDIGFLSSVDIGNNLVIVEVNVNDLDLNTDMLLKGIPSNIRVAVKLPSDFCDMKKVCDFSTLYPNTRYCGGNLIRIKGANIGCIGVDDIQKKIAESRIPLASVGCATCMQMLEFDDVTDLEFSKEKVTEPRVKHEKEKSNKQTKKASNTKPSKKKVLSSLVSSLSIEDDF